MTLFVKIVTGGPTHISISPTRWLVAATIILSQDLGRIDPSGWGGALRPRATKAAIATISIMFILLMIPAQSLWGFSSLGMMKRHDLYLLGAERKEALIPNMIFDRFWGGALALGAANIHLTNPRKKVQGGLGFSRDSVLDGLIPGVLLTTFLLGLGTDGGPEAVTEQVDQDRLRDYRVGIKFLEDGL